jgi:predicted dehydrogenase
LKPKFFSPDYQRDFAMKAAAISNRLGRRQFLQQAGLATASVAAAPAMLHSASANSKLQVACIGVGRMGRTTMNSVASHPNVEITALCDVDDEFLNQAAKRYPAASRYRDWREMLDELGDRYDAVTIGTPDHMHAAPAVTAVRKGKHVYLQKPMAGTLHECRVITQEAAKAGVVTQLGNQGRSSVESRMTVELLKHGAIGKIKEVILWENKQLNWWPQNTNISGQGDPIPKHLDWDLWLGVQEPRPYFENTYHPQYWRAWYGFGVGELGDMGCHHFDITFDALGLTAPLRVRQLTPGSDGPLWSKRRKVELIFPRTQWTANDTVKLTWYDGDLRPDDQPIQLPRGVDQVPESGTFWIGETGAIFKDYRGGQPIVLPEDDFPQEHYPSDVPQQNHYHDWVDAIVEGKRSCADFSHGGPLTEAVLVGAMADRVAGQWLNWDAENLQFVDNPTANALVRRQYRDGWRIEGV